MDHDDTSVEVDRPVPAQPGARLAVLSRLAERLMQSTEAAAVVLAALESIGALATYEYALLELIPGFGEGGAPTIFRATPQRIEAVAPAEILVDERSLLLPLVSGTRELGRLRVTPGGETFNPDEAAALRALAGYLGLALKLADLETTGRRSRDQEAQRRPGARAGEAPAVRRARISSIRAEMSQILSAQPGLSALCERVLDRLVNLLEVDGGAVYTYEAVSGDLVRASQRGMPGPLPARIAIAPEAPSALGRATAAGAPQIVRNLFTAPLQSDEDRILRTWGFQSLICFPLLAGKRISGGLQLLSRRTEALPSEVSSVLGAIGDELALAIQNAQAFDHLSTMAITDALTGLHNRRFCEEFMSKHLSAARRSRRGCGFLLVRIDGMQDLMATQGQPAVDILLRSVTTVVLRSVRAADLAGRYDDETIMIVLPNAQLNTTLTVAERVRSNLHARNAADDHAEPITVSIGATAYPECAGDLGEIISTAEEALHSAQSSGADALAAAPIGLREMPPER